jgi:chromosome segregation ATPase
MLGPVRFTHIQDCAREVCQVFRVEDEMQDCISTLQSLDDILADLRGELAKIKEEADSQPDYRRSKSEARSHPAKDYSALRKSLDTTKARRQISAREKAIESVKKLISEQREATSSALASGQSFYRVVSIFLKAADPCSANSYLMYPQLFQFTV